MLPSRVERLSNSFIKSLIYPILVSLSATRNPLLITPPVSLDAFTSSNYLYNLSICSCLFTESIIVCFKTILETPFSLVQ